MASVEKEAFGSSLSCSDRRAEVTWNLSCHRTYCMSSNFFLCDFPLCLIKIIRSRLSM